MGQRLEHDWFSQPLPENVVLGEVTWLYSTYAFLHYQSRMPTGVAVGHDTGLYNGTFFDLGPSGTVQIGDFCSLVGAIICTNSRVAIGDYTEILGGALIGEVAVIGAVTFVRCDVPPFAIYAGEPGRIVGDARHARG